MGSKEKGSSLTLTYFIFIGVLMVKHVISDFDLTKIEVHKILDISQQIKENPADYGDAMKNKTLITLFELPSLRTRISFEAGFNRMGGHSIFYSIAGGNFTRSETLEDGIKNLNEYCDVMMVRTLKQKDMERIGKAATIPAINGMTEEYHPCQNLADLLTVKEYKGKFEGLKFAYVGDGGCNTAVSSIIGGTSVGMEVTVVCPDVPRYSPSQELLAKAKAHSGKSAKVVHDPIEGIADADVVYTDVWISAGMEEESKKRMEVFPKFQVNMDLLSHAKKDSIVMHCLPAHRGYEITDNVMDSDQSVVFKQAGNRMHAQNGLLFYLLK